MEVQQRAYHKCPSCSLIFVASNHLPSGAEEIERYLKHRNNSGDSEYRDYLLRLLQPLLTRISSHNSGLDFGCGPVKMIEELLRVERIEVHSYDPFFFDDPELLKLQYDFIFCSEAAEHFHRPRLEFGKINDLLKPAGLLEVVTGIYRDDTDFNQWWYARDLTHVVFYCEQTFVWIAEQFGWDIVLRAGDITLFKKQS